MRKWEWELIDCGFLTRNEKVHPRQSQHLLFGINPVKLLLLLLVNGIYIVVNADSQQTRNR